MGTYISVASVRRTSGVSDTQVDDTDVEAAISEVEKQVPRKFNTVFAPTEKIDIADGDGTNRFLLDKNPVLAVRDLKIDGTTYDPDTLEVYKDSGYIFLGESAETSTFSKKRNAVSVKYLYGTLDESSTSTETDAASVAGSSVALSVTSESGFTTDDWVEIYGMDGNREAAQVSGTGTGEITVDQLILAHESDSTVVKLEINENFTKLMNIITSIGLVARVVGESADDIVGYNIGEMRVQKGEPYTQWRETANQLIKERDEIYGMISIRPRVTI